MWGNKAAPAAAGAALVLAAAALPAAAGAPDVVRMLQALPIDEPMRLLLEARYNESTSRLEHFQHDLVVVQLLTFLIGAMGAATAALQAVKDAWSRHARRATVAVGFTISLATMFRATFHPEEPASIRQRIGALESARKGLEGALMQVPRDSAQQLPYILDALEAFERGVTRAGVHATAAPAGPVVSLSLVASAEAAPADAAAALAPPDDAQTLYFTGRGADSSLEEAKARALADAVDKAAAALPGTARSPEGRSAEAAALREYVLRFRRDVDTRLRHDAATGGYEYHTVIAIPRLFTQPAIVRPYLRKHGEQAQGRRVLAPAALAATERVAVRCADEEDGSFTFVFGRADGAVGPSLALQRIEVHEDGSPGRARWRFDVSLRERPAFSLPPRDYDDHEPALALTGAEQVHATLGPLLGPAADLRVIGTRVRADGDGDRQ